MEVTNDYKNLINSYSNQSEIKKRFLQRLQEGNLTREENAANHFCVYFLPQNIATKEIFIVHHKKANLWIAPGGHIDRGETSISAVQRELSEELGYTLSNREITPFYFTITDLSNETRACKLHYDIWYLIPMKDPILTIDQKEFFNTQWISLQNAKDIVTEENNLIAFKSIDVKIDK